MPNTFGQMITSRTTGVTPITPRSQFPQKHVLKMAHLAEALRVHQVVLSIQVSPYPNQNRLWLIARFIQRILAVTTKNQSPQ